MSLAFVSVAKHHDDGTSALRGVSFTVPRGQFCILLGPSGAGKSTLLRTVTGLVTPSSGCTFVDGEAVTRQSLRRIRRKVGMIHQSFDLVPRASVADNVLSGALPAVSTLRALAKTFPRRLQERAASLIAEVGLEESHLGRRVASLSGGQQQRVGIARAFMLSPEYILADEPVASLDPGTGAEIMELIAREARENGAAVLCSLHQIDLARRFADRIVALKAGEVVFDGAPADIDCSTFEELYGSAGPAPLRIAAFATA